MPELPPLMERELEAELNDHYQNTTSCACGMDWPCVTRRAITELRAAHHSLEMARLDAANAIRQREIVQEQNAALKVATDEAQAAWASTATVNELLREQKAALVAALDKLSEEVWPHEADAEIGAPEKGATVAGPVQGETIIAARAALARVRGAE